jgi:hypothetical protein
MERFRVKRMIEIDHAAPLLFVVDLVSNPAEKRGTLNLLRTNSGSVLDFRGAVHPSLHTTFAVCPLGLTPSHVISGAQGASRSALQKRPPPPVDKHRDSKALYESVRAFIPPRFTAKGKP